MTTEHGPTRALELARALRADLRRALGALEAALAGAAGRRTSVWVTEVAVALRGLQHAFDAHVESTEAPEGLLAEAVAESPRLANAADRLRAEHVVLDQLIDERMADFESPPVDPDDDWVDGQRERLTELLALLVRHRQRGADLTFDAYGLDVGGES